MMSTVTPTLYVVAVNPRDLESSFVRAHLERLPARTVPVHGYVPSLGEGPLLSEGFMPKGLRKAARWARRQPWSEEITRGYVAAFRERPAAVLAEYGPTAVRVVDACQRARLPLVVHFHGYDASVRSVLTEHQEGYRRVFNEADAIIAVSRAMSRTLVDLGAPPHKVHLCHYGVDCTVFQPAPVAVSPPTFVAVGRLVEKKAPHLTVLAFAQVHREHPAARLRIIGDGPLLGPCRDLVTALDLDFVVTFLGDLPHARVQSEMREARAFVQHSVQALNGDCEGTPNAILEAGASGLPVVATRHAGIPDVVIEGETGFLVDERDVPLMARRMARLAGDGELAARMGHAARQHITSHFALETRLAGLWAVIETAIEERSLGRAVSSRAPMAVAID